MAKRQNLTPDEQARIAELREEKGYSYGRIARIIGCSVGSVGWCCLKLGIRKPGANLSAQRPPATMIRAGRQVRMFTAEEDATINAMAVAGASHSEIARALNRAPNSIAGRLFTLARRQEEIEQERTGA